MPEFRPSDVALLAPVPLMDTMQNVRREQAAAMLVRAAVLNGDDWLPCTIEMVEAAVKHDRERKVQPLCALWPNPAFRPSFYLLVEGGYAQYTEAFETNPMPPIEFTELGFEALRKYVR